MRNVQLATFIAFALVMTPFAANATPTTSVVGVQNNDNSQTWICTVEDSTHIQCGFATSADGLIKCDEITLPSQYSTFSSATGIYLVPDFAHVGGIEQVAFMPALYTSGGTSYWGILRLEFTEKSSISNCL